MRVGPYVPTILPKKRYLIFYIFLIWISIITITLEFWIYWQLTWDYIRPIFFYLYLPPMLFGIYVSIVLVSIAFAKLLLVIVNAIHKPKEGVFLRDVSDKDYRYWTIRNTIKRWPVWLSHRFPFPFMDNICFKVFGVKTKFSNSLFEGWVDTEFIEFGENVVIGQGSHITSAMIIGNLLIMKKIKIGDNVRIGTHSYVMPGTEIGDNCVLSSWSTTTVDQKLEEGYVYVGLPARKFKKNIFFEDGLEDVIGHIKDVEDIREKYEKMYTRRHDKGGIKERVSSKLEKIIEERKKVKEDPDEKSL